MNIIKLFSFLFVIFFSFTANSEVQHYDIIQKSFNGNVYKEPVYRYTIHDHIYKDQYDIEFYADSDNFPFSSLQQGSVFYQIFSHLMEKEHISVWIYCTKNSFDELTSLFEHGEGDISALFGIYFKEIPYSANKYFYPAFAENNIHLITANNKTLDVKTKEDLKKYKGLYTSQDRLPDFVQKDMKRLGITEKASYEEMYEELLTGRVDFVVASYYKGQIELYKLGLRNFVKLSRTPVWSIPMFFRFTPKKIKHPRLQYLKKYLQSTEYKQIRDKALEDMLNIYKENTRGIIPPTYMNSFQSPINTHQNN